MELERYLDQTIEEFRKKFGVSNEFQSELKEDAALRNTELSDEPSGRLGDNYIRAMELAGFEFVEATDLCYFKDKVSKRILGLDYEPCIYDHLQEMDLPEDTRERIERIVPKAEWKIVKPVFDKEYLHFELELKEHGIVSHLPGTYKLQDSSEPRMHIQSETFEQDMGVLYRDFDRMERCLKEIVLEKEKVRELAEDLMKKSEFHKEDSEAIDIVEECQVQEQKQHKSHFARQEMQMEMNPVNWVQTM